jgi:membrane peptidoglycan carboxypeptidase
VSETKRPAGRQRAGEQDGRSTTRVWVKRGFLLLATVFGLGLLLFAFAYATTDIPDPNKGFEAQTTYVYYDDGKTVLGKFAEQDRTTVPLEDIPQHVQDAVIAAEDRTFWTNKGLDPKGILRAAFNNAKGGSTQGASTITQ